MSIKFAILKFSGRNLLGTATYRVCKGEWSGAEIFKEKFNLLDRVCEAVKGLVQLYHYESQQTLYSTAIQPAAAQWAKSHLFFP